MKSSDAIPSPSAPRALAASAADQSVASSPAALRKSGLTTSFDERDKIDKEAKKKLEEERRKEKEREKREEEERKRKEKEEEDRRRKEKEREEEERLKREKKERKEREREEEERRKKEKEEEERRKKEKEREEEDRRKKEKEREREEEERLKREKKERKEREKHNKAVEFAPEPPRKESKATALNLSQSLLDSVSQSHAPPQSPSLNALLSPRATTPHEPQKSPTVADLRQMVDEGRRVAAELKASNSTDHDTYESEVEVLAKRLETALRKEREEEARKEEEARQAAEVEREAARKKELEVLEANVQKASKRRSIRREVLTEAEKKKRMQALEDQFARIQAKKNASTDELKPPSKALRSKTLNPAKLKKMAKAFDDRLVQTVPAPTNITLEEHFIFDSKGRPNYELMKNHFLKEGRIEHKACRRLIEGARRHFEKEPNILELQAPVVSTCCVALLCARLVAETAAGSHC